MADPRELILTRLLAVAAAVDGVKKAKRNELGENESALPLVVIFDGDEAASDSDPQARPPTSPRIVTMTPEIYLILADKATAVGTEVNLMRARFINAVANDAQLASLTHKNEGGRYEGAATSLSRGRQMLADVGLSFSFRYVLRPGSI